MNNEQKEQRSFRLNEDYKDTLIGLVWLGMIAVAGVWGYNYFLADGSWRNIIGGERAGVIRYDDCREIIQLSANTKQRYYKKFTCEYRDGDKTCARTKNNYFTGACEKAFVYESSLDDYLEYEVGDVININGEEGKIIEITEDEEDEIDSFLDSF